jgi:hypothetical protein
MQKQATASVESGHQRLLIQFNKLKQLSIRLMTFIDRTNSSALQKKSRAVQENLLVQKFQR